ncbi:uncharacterized protein LOC134825110 [Bolinopsis microptera]|uniref:uncharacterized protein LOC134825110 n=1 Tax=Bolinopsis microptera TaxID=2820187 RepID=UPI00307A8F0C
MMFALTTLLAVVGLVTGDGVGHNKLLNFPSASIANYISYKTDLPAMTGLTVCAWQQKSYSDDKRCWFSYAVSGSTNEILLGEREKGVYVFYFAGSNFGANVGSLENQWVHVCAAWDSESGVAVISVNGEAAATQENFKKGASVSAAGNLVIGQEQDSVGGGFDASQAYVGRLYNINVWNYALNSTEVSFLYETGLCGFGSTEEDPIISYADILGQDMTGNLAVVDGLCIDLEDPSEGQIMRFPPQSKASTKNFLQFTPNFEADDFAEFSICTWFFKTYGDQSRYFLSYAVSGLDNSIILGEQATLGFWVSGEKILTDILLDQQTWYHLCFTWASDSGAAIYVDGAKVKEGALATGKTQNAGGVMNVGQEQDSVGGGYDANKAFAGSLYNLNMFRSKLSDDQVTKLYAEGTFCEKIPDEMWEAGAVMVAYKDLFSLIPGGDVVFDSGEAAWRHGAIHCRGDDLDVDAHKPDCWKTEKNTSYKDSGSLGYIVGDLDAAKAACAAYGKCKTLTCADKDGVLKCEMKESIEKAKKDKKKTSYTYRC